MLVCCERCWKTFFLIIFLFCTTRFAVGQKNDPFSQHRAIILDPSPATGHDAWARRAFAFKRFGMTLAAGFSKKTIEKEVDFLFTYLAFVFPEGTSTGNGSLIAYGGATAIRGVGDDAIPSVLRNTERKMTEKECLLVAFILLGGKNDAFLHEQRRKQLSAAVDLSFHEDKRRKNRNLRRILELYDKVSLKRMDSWPKFTKEEIHHSRDGFDKRFHGLKHDQ